MEKKYLLIILFTFSINLFAQEGALDVTFSADGKVLTNVMSSGSNYGYGVEIQSDGKIIVAGLNDYDRNQIIMARYNSDGSLDNTFNSTGVKIVLPVDLTDVYQFEQISDVAINSFGKILVCGSIYLNGASYTDLILVQFRADGTLDQDGFGTNGFKVVDISSGNDYVEAMEIQADDKIVVVGFGGNTQYYQLVRFTSDGNLDSDFGSSGKVISSLAGQARAVDILSDGSIIVGGQSNYNYAILKLNSTGVVDNTFATGGVLYIDFGGPNETCYALASDILDNIFVGGVANYNFTVAKSNSSGSLVTGFGTDGKVSTDVGNGQADYIYSLECQLDGKLLAAGFRERDYIGSKYQDFAIARYNTDGTLDTSFGSDGILIFNFNSNNQAYGICRDIKQQADGKIIMAGYHYNGSTRDFAIARVTNSAVPVPVELTLFAAQVLENTITLSWQTATEVNNYGFEIERKNNTNDKWENIGFVEGHGNSNSPKDYSFVDYNPIGNKISYRLKQIETDGSFEYSEIVVVISEIPLEYKLSQNYPNPFNPSTIIEFAIPTSGNVKLSIFNSLGQEVAVLINEEMSAGNYNYQFSSTNYQLSSGIYFCKLTSGNYTQTNKMLLLK